MLSCESSASLRGKESSCLTIILQAGKLQKMALLLRSWMSHLPRQKENDLLPRRWNQMATFASTWNFTLRMNLVLCVAWLFSIRDSHGLYLGKEWPRRVDYVPKRLQRVNMAVWVTDCFGD